MDKYDRAVEYLTQHPSRIPDAWNCPNIREGGCLFTTVTKNPSFCDDYGCLTEIRRGKFSYGRAETEELTKAILNDERIPKEGSDITVEHLPIFAEWQRRIDKELNRE